MADRPTTPSEAVALARRVSGIYHDASVALLERIGRRVARGLDVTRDRARLAELRKLNREAAAVVTKTQRIAEARVVGVVEEAFHGGLGRQGLLNQRAVQALGRSIEQLNQAGPQMLRWTDDVYRQVTAEAVGRGLAVGQTRQQVAARALSGFAARGITGFVDGSGAMYRIESYTEMATRTGLHHSYVAGTIERLAEDGRDLVVISASVAACPLCRPYEGHVFSLSGTSTEYPPLSSAESGGLFHPNCTHTPNAFTPGLTTDPPSTPVGAAQRYRARQRQRVLERRVEESRRRVAAVRGIGDAKTLAYERALMASRRAALRTQREELRSLGG